MSNFTFSHYSETLNRYQAAGYTVLSFAQFLALSTPPQRTLILRHDIDFSLTAALRMARLDHDAGVSSSFFFRLHATNYHPASLESLRAYDEIRSLGHEIGLHLEPGMPHLMDADADTFCDRMKVAFESIIGHPIAGFSTHEPARADNPELVDSLARRWGVAYHAYQPRFTREMKYLSDSGARWREGCFSEWIGKVDRLQVLVHPIWWYERGSQECY